jgi:L-cysteine/cystine lyase
VRELPPKDALHVLLDEVTPRTRLFALSEICWMSGNRFPTAELRETGLPVLVDGAQSAGAIAVDASQLDFYAFSCQKWLCGPDGTGGLVVADPERLGIAAPSYLSQESYKEIEFVARPGAARFDPGWTPPPSLAGLSAALDLAPTGRFERATEMAARCRALLAARFDIVTAPDQATLVSFRVEEDPAEVVERLYKHGVIVRDIPNLGWIRVSCGWWTSEEDLTRLVAAL